MNVGNAIFALAAGVALFAALPAHAADSAADETFAASFEVRVHALTNAPMGFGFYLQDWHRYSEGPLKFEIPAGPVSRGPDKLMTGMDTTFRPDLWHHLAVVYRRKPNTAHVYVDGELVGVGHTVTATPPDAQKFLDAPRAGEGFPGEIRNVRTWKAVPTDAELFPPAVLDPIRAKCRAVEASLVKGFDGKAPKSGILPVAIERHGREKHVPFRTPADASVLGVLRMAAAQGEIEDASFLLLPFRDFSDVMATVSDLKGPGGATIAADRFDIRLVVCWLQCRGGWRDFYTQGIDFPALTPENLVHDEKLLYFDRKTCANMLRVSHETGDTWISVSDRADLASYGSFDYNREPVRDAKTLQPFALENGRYRQLWFTLRCPEDAKPGAYAGTVAIRAKDGAEILTVPLALTVHPFVLPLPDCHYAPDKAFVTSWMGHYELVKKIADSKSSRGSGNLEASLKRLYVEFRNMAEHNCGYPFSVSYADNRVLADYVLDVQEAAGCEMRPLFGDVGARSGLAYRNSQAKGKGKAMDFTIPESLKAHRDEMVSWTNVLKRSTDLVCGRLGHREIIYAAFDEAPASYIRQSYAVFVTVNHFGGITFTTSGDENEAAFITDWNDGPGFFSFRNDLTFEWRACQPRIRKWHDSGARIFSYGSPHSGPECPDIWRRGKGLGAYLANMDGAVEYIWYEGSHIWNEFVDGSGSGYRNFCMTHPTIDGVLDSVQWEAEREGLDDIRYLSYLYRLAQTAIDADDAALKAEGRRMTQWVNLTDWENADLDKVRLDAAGRIVALREKLEKAGLYGKIAFRYPRKAKPYVPKLPEPDAQADPVALRREAKRWADLSCCDVALRFYKAAAKNEPKKDLRRGDWANAADCAVRYNDFKEAYACCDAGELLVKKAMLSIRPRGRGWKLDAKTVAIAERSVMSRGTVSERIEVLRAVLEVGDPKSVAQRATAIFDSVGATDKHGTVRCAAGGLAGAAYRKMGDYKRASLWYERAAPFEWVGSTHMLENAAECAQLAGDDMRALKCYQDALSRTSKEDGFRYAMFTSYIRNLTKRTSGKVVPTTAESDNPTEGITLDDE